MAKFYLSILIVLFAFSSVTARHRRTQTTPPPATPYNTYYIPYSLIKAGTTPVIFAGANNASYLALLNSVGGYPIQVTGSTLYKINQGVCPTFCDISAYNPANFNLLNAGTTPFKSAITDINNVGNRNTTSYNFNAFFLNTSFWSNLGNIVLPTGSSITGIVAVISFDNQNISYASILLLALDNNNRIIYQSIFNDDATGVEPGYCSDLLDAVTVN